MNHPPALRLLDCEQTIRHEAAHAVAAHYIGCAVTFIQVAEMTQSRGCVQFRCRNKIQAAQVGLAPLIFGLQPSAQDVEGVPPEIESDALAWLGQHVEDLRREAYDFIERKLYIFRDGRQGRIVRPFSHFSRFIPA